MGDTHDRAGERVGSVDSMAKSTPVRKGSVTDRAFPHVSATLPSILLSLQRTAGNSAVTAMLDVQRQTAAGVAAGSAGTSQFWWPNLVGCAAPPTPAEQAQLAAILSHRASLPERPDLKRISFRVALPARQDPKLASRQAAPGFATRHGAGGPRRPGSTGQHR